MPTTRSRPSLFDRITSWLDSILNPKKPQVESSEIVLRQIEVKVPNPGDRLNLVEEIKDPEPWSLATFRIRPIHHKHNKTKSGTSASPTASTIGEVSYYLFVHKIPPKHRGKAIAVTIAGKRYLITDTSLDWGFHQVSLLRIPDKHNKATWFYPYKKAFRFSGIDGGDLVALRLAEIFVKHLVISDLANFKFGQQLEQIVRAGKLGTWKEQDDERRDSDPFMG